MDDLELMGTAEHGDLVAQSKAPAPAIKRKRKQNVTPFTGKKMTVYIDIKTGKLLEDARQKLDRTASWLIQHSLQASLPGLIRRYEALLKVDGDE